MIILCRLRVPLGSLLLMGLKRLFDGFFDIEVRDVDHDIAKVGCRVGDVLVNRDPVNLALNLGVVFSRSSLISVSGLAMSLRVWTGAGRTACRRIARSSFVVTIPFAMSRFAPRESALRQITPRLRQPRRSHARAHNHKAKPCVRHHDRILAFPLPDARTNIPDAGASSRSKAVTRSVTKTPRDGSAQLGMDAMSAPLRLRRTVTGETRHAVWDRVSGAHNPEVAGSNPAPATNVSAV